MNNIENQPPKPNMSAPLSDQELKATVPNRDKDLSLRIKPIDADVVKSLCTAQVVVSLANACKELIENALDAGATSIEIRLKNYGLDLIEVLDNGFGIAEENFDQICKPHHTSKIAKFDDLPFVNSYGFRGEALNALCSLAHLELITRTASAQLATALTFDSNGTIKNRLNVARQPGTTVRVTDLFHALPVRRKELERNVKREFAKLLTVVQSYALISCDVRLLCTSVGTDKKATLVCTHGGRTLRENLCSVLGTKQLETLVSIDSDQSISESIIEEFHLDDLAVKQAEQFKLSGFVSTVTHGSGRSTTDRQFVYVNQRPCDYPKVCKMANDAYRQFNRGQYPVFIICIQVENGSVDRNLTPDKRRVLVCNENVLLALVKSTLLTIFNRLAAVVLAPAVARQAPATGLIPEPRPGNNVVISGASNMKRYLTESLSTQQPQPIVKQQRRLQDFAFRRNVESTTTSSPEPQTPIMPQQQLPTGSKHHVLLFDQDRDHNKPSISSETEHVRLEQIVQRNTVAPGLDPRPRLMFGKAEHDEQIRCATSPVLRPEHPSSSNADVPMEDEMNDGIMAHSLPNQASNETTVAVPTLVQRSRGKVSVSLDAVRRLCANNKSNVNESAIAQTNFKFEARLTASQQEEAEQELSRQLRLTVHQGSSVQVHLRKLSTLQTSENVKFCLCRKSEFTQMHVFGQFNKGFIITRLGAEIFIVDQHASDEKYMFETYQRNAVIQSQRMIQPKPLHLNAVSEAVLRDNEAIFRKNGFEFQFNSEPDANGCRVSLISAPCLHGWVFDKNDIDDIIAFLTEFPGVSYRPPRLRKIFASKACRKSVMIGRSLNHAEMCKIVQHLATLDNPWSCPHGRPTLRHLTNLNDIFPQS